jgi:hypothetical protein
LTGAQLDYWVAKAEDEFAAFITDGACHCAVDDEHTFRFAPSTDWERGGPIIEREGIAVWRGEGEWCATHPSTVESAYSGRHGYIDVDRFDSAAGATPLIAAMRAYVASKFGEDTPE